MIFVIAGIFLGFVFAIGHPSGRAFFLSPFNAHRTGRGQKRFLAAMFALCVAGIWFVLRADASVDVRTNSDFTALYLTLCTVWILLAVLWFEFLGVSVRDDVVERRNFAATAVICGLMAGVTLCLAGANTGEGTGPEVVLGCSVLATTTLFLLWLLLNFLTGIVDSISIDRNVGAGIRGAVFLIGGGAIIGASVAGDWISLERTLVDYARFCWPVVVLLVLAVFIEKHCEKRQLTHRSEIYFSVTYGALVVMGCATYAVNVWNR